MNISNNELDSEEKRKLSLIQRFFIICSGADKGLIKQCPTEWNKYSIIGALILLTASLSFVSGTYFLSFVFSDKVTGKIEVNWLQSCAFGLLWASLIFSLDRTIIVSLKKTGVFKQEIKQGSIRIVLAIFIGIVIATPVELKLFENEIKAKVEENNNIRKKDIIIRNNENLVQQLQPLKQRLSDLQKIKDDYSRADSICTAEIEGLSATGKIGKGPAWQEKENSRQDKKKEWGKVESEYDLLQAQIKNLTNRQPSSKDNDNKSNIDGPEARVKALYQLSGLHWFVTLLFILIECLPVISKLMTKRGPYDEILDRTEYEIMIEQKEIISRKNSEINELLVKGEEAAKLRGDAFIKTNKLKQDIELQNNEKLLTMIALKQETLAKIAINNWYEEELNKLNSKSTQSSKIRQTHQLEEILWKQKASPDTIVYYFKTGSHATNELVYVENDQIHRGKWAFNRNQNEIAVELFNTKTVYLIIELTTTLRLQEKGINEFIEFEKA